MNVGAFMSEVNAAIEHAVWALVDTSDTKPAGGLNTFRSYTGTHKQWRFLVVFWSTDQGSSGYDGTSTLLSQMTVIRMTPEQAKRAYDRACESAS